MKPLTIFIGAFACAALLGSAVAVVPALADNSTFRAVVRADLKNIDPIWTTAYISRNHGYMVWDTLFATDENFEIHPRMAESADVSEDGLTYTIKLRPDLTWHDGSAVTPDDCIASIRRWGQRDSMGQQMMVVVESIEAVDDLTFMIKLKEPWGLVLAALGKMSSNVPFMMPKRLAETDPFEPVPDSIGSGPYIFVKDEWVPGSKVVYIKNEDYVPRSEPASAAAAGKVVKVDRVEWIYIPDPATTMNALVNGEVDLWETPTVDMVPLLEQHEGVELAVIDPLGTQGWLRPNHLHFPFNHPSARKAVLYSVNQEDYLRAIVGDPKLYRVCDAYFICGAPNESSVGVEALETVDHDKARVLLKEAGYNGEKIILMQPTDIAALNESLQVTAQLLRQSGIDVEVQTVDWSTRTSRRTKRMTPEEGRGHNFHTSWIAPDLVNLVPDTGVSGGGKEKAWFGWPYDPEIEALRRILVDDPTENVNSDWIHCGNHPWPCPPPPCPRPCPFPPPCPECPPCPGPWCPFDMSASDYGALFDKTNGVGIPQGLTRDFDAFVTDGGRLW